MVKDDKVKIAFVWSNIKKPIGGAEYFLIDVLEYIRSLKIANITISVYDIAYGLSLIKELNNYDVVVMYSLNDVLPIIPLTNTSIMLDIHSPDWLWYFREKAYGIKPRPETLVKRLWIKTIGRKIYCRVLNSFDYNIFSIICKKTFLVPNFIDTSRFRPTKNKLDDFTIIVRYNPSFKGGFDIFIKALRFLGKTRWLNVIIYGGEPSRQVLNVIDKYANYVNTLGKLPTRDLLVDLYSQSHAVIIPSRYEGFSLTALESLACGTPIIVSRLPPTNWFLSEISNSKPGTGLSFKPGDPAELAQRIELMYRLWLNKIETYAKSSFLCRKVALKFDISKIIPQYLSAILSITGRVRGAEDSCYIS
jgi:glycosyltransferase involved in cell wall biosynthesis